MLAISIIIPTLNAAPHLPTLLQSLRAQQLDHTPEIIIIDSESSDPTLTIAQHFNAKTLSIPRKNFNHGKTRNLAIQHSTGDLLVLLSQDVLPANNQLLANLAQNFADPKVAAAYARHQPRPNHNPIIRQNVLQHSGSILRRESFLPDPSLFNSLPPLEQFFLARFDNVCSCIRRSVWNQIPFPPKNFAEDLAWSRLVLQFGRKIIYDPTALIIHSHDLTLRDYYRRVYQTHRALREIFNLQLIPRRNQIHGQFLRDLQTQFAHIHRSPLPLLTKAQLLSAQTLRSLCTVLATYNGGKSIPRNRPISFTSVVASTHPNPLFSKL